MPRSVRQIALARQPQSAADSVERSGPSSHPNSARSEHLAPHRSDDRSDEALEACDVTSALVDDARTTHGPTPNVTRIAGVGAALGIDVFDAHRCDFQSADLILRVSSYVQGSSSRTTHEQGATAMCILCKQGQPQNHFGSRRTFLKGAAATGATVAGLNLFAPRAARADDDTPQDSGRNGRRYVIRGGAVMSMDRGRRLPAADVLVEGKKIVAVGPNAGAGFGGEVIDATGRIVMPGFIDTHHHQFETALRSFLADGVLILDGDTAGGSNGEGAYAYYQVHPAQVRAGLPAAGCLHQRGVRRPVPARRRRHHGARRLADPSLAAAFRRRRPGAVRHRAPCRIRLFRGRRRQGVVVATPGIRLSAGRHPASRKSGFRRPTSSST